MVRAQPKPIEAAELPALRLPPEMELTDALLLELSELNEAWRLERTASGELSMTLPSFPLSSSIHVDLNYQLFGWSLAIREGRLFDAEIGIVLPDSALTMPDAAWFDAAQAAQIDEHDFIRIAPAFVLEVRSASQTLVKQQDKMERWMVNGVRLGLARRSHSGDRLDLPAGRGARAPGAPAAGQRRAGAARLRSDVRADLAVGRVYNSLPPQQGDGMLRVGGRLGCGVGWRAGG